jgi:glycogen operon protein
MSPRIWPGQPYPFGATFDGYGTNFAAYSSVAERVELCLIHDGDGGAAEREERIDLTLGVGHVWHGYLPRVRPGQRYGYRVHGPWEPRAGVRCNAAKLLADPYARGFAGALRWSSALFAHDRRDPDGPPNREDSAPFMLKSVVEQAYFDWGNDKLPRIPWHETVIYEVHVKGFTIAHPRVPPELRGTYLGVSHPTSIEHLQRLGVTAVELLPVHQFVHEGFLLERGLRDYWGYNSLGYFAPHDEYAAAPGDAAAEFKYMVKALHHAGIEVILDVVYNHTAEGNHLGPTLSLRGLDNAAYYKLVADDPRYYQDYTGTGNTLNVRHPNVLQLIMDSLRYWVSEMHVDGFRFDLAAALARELHEVDRLSAFFDLIHQDPIISRVKLIAEPWDVGQGGYQVGNFPPLWSEWNGLYRDCVRDLWRGQRTVLGDFATRFTGSSDLYAAGARRPHASINFVTCHDGFTLRDLVSYDHKHNDDNGEDNRDGTDDNRSWNCGAEGATVDPQVLALRARQSRNLLATLFLSQGIPMLLGGDEIGRSQRGNHNGYCQDSDVSWFDWDHADHDLLAFARALGQFYRAHPVFRRRGWFQGRPIHGSRVDDIGWFTPGGERMVEADWSDAAANVLGVFLNGEGIITPGARGERILDDSFYIAFNAHHEPTSFHIPRVLGGRWRLVMDTGRGFVAAGVAPRWAAGDAIDVAPRTLALLQRLA